MTEMQWPPARGIPAKNRYKKARDLQWGETPFDDLDRGELLRLVQAYHAAAVGANSVLGMMSHGQEGHLYWSGEGSGGKAKAKLEFLIRRAGDGGMNSASENIYRKFFRHAYGLLFPGLGDQWDQWGIDEKTGEMFAPYTVGERSPLRPEAKMRAVRWRDLLPIRSA